VPLQGGGFGLVVSEDGASVWCDPERWVAEAARLLRPGGRLGLLANSVLAARCVPAEGGVARERLVRPSVVDALHEPYAPADAQTRQYYGIATAQWASRWPVEDLWAAHLSTDPGEPGR
jgi:SAM-dependent methyltransferase